MKKKRGAQGSFQTKPPCRSRFHSLPEQEPASGSPKPGLYNQFGEFLFLLYCLQAVGHLRVRYPPAAAAQCLSSPPGEGQWQCCSQQKVVHLRGTALYTHQA